jgi:hypothetical protein
MVKATLPFMVVVTGWVTGLQSWVAKEDAHCKMQFELLVDQERTG